MTPNALSTPPVALACLFAYIGVYHLIIYFRMQRERRVFLTFALTCFATVPYTIGAAGIYGATSLYEGITWQQWEFMAAGPFALAFLAFAMDYLHLRWGTWAKLGAFLLLAISLAGLANRDALVSVDGPFSFKQMQVPLLGSVTYYEAQPGLLGVLMFSACHLAFGAVLILALYQRMRSREPQRRAGMLALACVVFLAGVASDTAVTYQLYEFVYVMEYGFVAIVVLMAVALANELFEASVARAERDALQNQLFHSQRVESLGRLAGAIAHDFNNALVPILLYTDGMLFERKARETELEELQQIKKAALGAKGLTQQLLAYGRKETIEAARLELNAFLTESAPMLSRLVRPPITLRWRLCKEEAWVKCDATQMQQILMNLSMNAVDAMGRGGDLTVATRVSADAKLVFLEVSDRGCGIEKADLDKIFEPFYTTKEQGKGTGLGLATVYRIVKQHGGQIEVVSTVGEGTTFTITLPRATEAKTSGPESP